MLTERNISYTRNKVEAEDLGFTRFEYEARHIPTGKRKMCFVYCRNRTDALELVNFWTCEDWVYKIPA